MARFIFVTGGVVSSLGKGLSSASLAYLLQSRGFNVRLRKLDPYLNVDPGTMSPFQHGEVFVTDDGAETDLDLGHYERFSGISAKKSDNITTGKIYSDVLRKERKGGYLGKTVQVIPHITDRIKDFIKSDTSKEDFVICEIGGIVGDIESLPFVEAIRQFSNDVGKKNALFIHLTLVPYLKASDEIKTKPTQHSVKELRSLGIQPDIIICRSERPIPLEHRKKISLFCNVGIENVIQTVDVKTIYEAPISFNRENLDKQVLEYFKIKSRKKVNLNPWKKITKIVLHTKKTINIAIIGKYVELKDAYKSLDEALTHGGIDKTSFDKANRTSLKGKRGMGLEQSLPIFDKIKKELKVPILTDIHNAEQCSVVAPHVDVLQIPAFLCRQTDLLISAAKTGKIINVKKGQFLAPWDMVNVTKKIADSGNNNILVTERGASFGYNTLVSDMRSLPIMAKNGYPVIFDATHSVQQPGGLGETSGGQREFVEYLARAAVAVGVAGVFIETHQDPDNAPSDGPNMVPLDKLEKLLSQLFEIDNLIKK